MRPGESSGGTPSNEHVRPACFSLDGHQHLSRIPYAPNRCLRCRRGYRGPQEKLSNGSTYLIISHRNKRTLAVISIPLWVATDACYSFCRVAMILETVLRLQRRAAAIPSSVFPAARKAITLSRSTKGGRPPASPACLARARRGSAVIVSRLRFPPFRHVRRKNASAFHPRGLALAHAVPARVRATVPTPIPSCWLAHAMDMPLRRNSVTSSRPRIRRGRPKVLPALFASRMAALIRSRIRDRSNPAAAPRTWNRNREAGLFWSVSRPWVMAINRAPQPSRV
jgi:hypothetical protein